MRLNETDLTQIRIFMTIYTQDGLLADGSDADRHGAAAGTEKFYWRVG